VTHNPPHTGLTSGNNHATLPFQDNLNTGGICMKGGIYSEEKCPLCGATLQYTEKRGIACPEHPQIRGEKCRVIFGRQLRRKFSSLRQAEHFLNGIRHEVEQGKFDKRDYQKENPLGFITRVVGLFC